jgi:hypothetical protein
MLYAGPFLTGTVMVIVQGYYVRRLWAVSPRSLPVLHLAQNIELKLIDDDGVLGLFAIVETTS